MPASQKKTLPEERGDGRLARKARAHPSFHLLLPLLLATLLILMAAACQAQPASNAVVNATTPVPRATSAKPAVVFTVAAPAALPSFRLLSPEEMSSAGKENSEAEVKAISTTLPVAAPALPAATPTITPTPQPTFTPPALPLTSPDEHYWLRRPVAEGGVVWTNKAYPYGSTRGGQLRTHHGVEFDVSTGTEILAVASGTVRVAGDDATIAYGPQTDFYGHLVIIELDSRLDGQPVYTLYGHLSQVLVGEGQRVETQEVIALSGVSGVADGPHMHFEVRVGQNSYAHTRNPLLWLYPFPDRGAVAGRVVWPDGQLLRQAPVTLRRVDAPSRYAATTTYAGDSVNPDPIWQENFTLDDVDAGYYEVVVNVNGDKYEQNLWVFPYRTSFVEIILPEGE